MPPLPASPPFFMSTHTHHVNLAGVATHTAALDIKINVTWEVTNTSSDDIQIQA